MRKTSLICGLLLAAVSPLASAVVIDGLDSDADFVDFRDNNDFVKSFGGNVRWGNGETNGDWEYAIVNGSDAPVSDVGQADWSDGVNSHTFTFEFTGSTANLDLSGIGDVSADLGPGSLDTLLFRVRDSDTPFTELSNIRIDVGLDGTIDYTLDSLVGDNDANYWGVYDTGLAAGFRIMADADFAGPEFRGSDPMYQVKFGTSRAQVPEPPMMALLLVGLLGGAVARRRRG